MFSVSFIIIFFINHFLFKKIDSYRVLLCFYKFSIIYMVDISIEVNTKVDI